MFIVKDNESEGIIGPFSMYEDAVSFVTKVESMSGTYINGLEVFDVTEPNEWIYENMDNILMANF